MLMRNTQLHVPIDVEYCKQDVSKCFVNDIQTISISRVSPYGHTHALCDFSGALPDGLLKSVMSFT
jgi:hypothetical protein